MLNEITPLRELPETAFMSKPNPLDEIRFRLKPSSAEVASIKERDLYQKFLNAINRKDIDDTFNRIIRSQYMDLDLLRNILKNV